ncbi:MAG: PIN domain-containing protein [Armatimonadota bacterium]
MKFWDTSALFVLLAVQKGSSNAAEIFNSDPEVAIWWGTPVELASAAARLKRMGEVDEADYARIFSKIGPLAQSAEEVQPSEEVRQTALRLIRVHDLRAADALQLAAALVWTRHVPAGLDFVCLDARLSIAAEKEGFSVQK